MTIMPSHKSCSDKYPAYKDSGVEWLGVIPEGWEINKLFGLCHFVRGNSGFGKDELLSTGKYVAMQYGKSYQINEVDEKYEFYINDEYYKDSQIVNYGDTILISISETIEDLGHSVYYNRNDLGLLGGEQMLLKPKIETLNYKYLYYLSKVFSKELRKYASGIKVFRFNINDLKTIYTPFPPLQEQTAIANFLDDKTAKIDRAIAQKEKMIALLKERKQIIIQNAVTKGLNPNAKMKDSGVEWIGEIPEDWGVSSNKILFKESKLPGRDSLPLLSVSIHSAVSTEELGDEDNIRGLIKIEDKTNYKYVAVNDIVFNMMRAWQGAIGAVKVEGMVSPAYIVARPNNKILATFFEYQYRSEDFIQQMNRNSKGITDFRKRLYWDEFKQLKTVVSPIQEQTAIVAHIEAQSAKVDKAIKLQEQQIEKLKELKSTLIDGAVTGKIKVS